MQEHDTGGTCELVVKFRSDHFVRLTRFDQSSYTFTTCGFGLVSCDARVKQGQCQGEDGVMHDDLYSGWLILSGCRCSDAGSRGLQQGGIV